MAEQQIPSPGNQSINSPVSLTLMDPDVLECPICCDTLKIPIFQCTNGHLACSPCCEKLGNQFPSCKSPIGYSRCRAMERVIESIRVPCPNATYGCKEHTAFGKPSSQEMQCLFTPCSCPVSDCNYTGLNDDLFDHVCAKHKDNLLRFLWDINFVIEWDLKKTIAVLQEEKDGEVIVVQVFSRPHGLTVSVSCFAHLAPRFSCCLRFATSNITLKQAFLLREIYKVSDEETEDGFMLILSHMLPSHGKFTLGICFSRGWSCVSRA